MQYRVKLGATLYHFCRPKNTSDTPTAPDAAPTWAVYSGDPDNPVSGSTGTMSAVSGTSNKLWLGSQVCSEANGYESGKTYTMVRDWAISSVAKGDEITIYVD